ncbi:MAG: 2-oxo acid dehydrogenase subunit E2 [Planctomycetes bacterium]|nr:2-oxo acid dehydrogenase subunit E2 [Planctomycetota bacterium]
MATAVVLPKQGNSVESCVIKGWLKKVGDAVKEGDALCEVETDKATVEVPSSASGVLLAIFRPAGDDVPVQTAICAVGNAGEDVAALAPAGAAPAAPAAPAASSLGAPGSSPALQAAPTAGLEPGAPREASSAADAGSSPRARAAAQAAGIDIARVPASGPQGLVIERDVQAVASGQAQLTPAARAAAAGGLAVPASGTGIGGRVLAGDLGASAPAATAKPACAAPAAPGAVTDTPVKGIRKIVAERMRASLGGTAQLTLNATAKAVAIQAWRAKAKASAEALGLPGISINDLVMFAVSRTLPRFPALNAHFLGDKVRQFADVNLGVAVDTDKGLMVPVLAQANRKSLAQIAGEFKPLAKACQAGKATPEQLTGGTFTITNLGALGIEYFTPVLNAPEVAILGVGGLALKPYEGKDGVEFLPALHLSLTIDHQALDGAPAARFLQALVAALENIDVLLAA